MREILSEAVTAFERQQDCVLCTLVETRGSTPQKPGAAMLVFPDGSQRGTLGGGCVEAEVKQRALRLLPGGRAELLTFHLDDNYGWDDGLICGGRMTIAAQPLPRASGGATERGGVAEYLREFRRLAYAGRGCTEAILLADLEGLPAGARFLIDEQGSRIAALYAENLPAKVAGHLISVRERPRAYHHENIAFLPILPRITLLIVGGGHVGHAVAKLAAECEFIIWVLDDREAYAGPERFPQAERRIVGDMGRSLHELRPHIDESMYCLIVTRGHAHDEEALYHLATTNAGYVGMIGSKRKIRLIFDDLIAKGVPKEALDRVHAPLGLDIGSQTVPEIAVSLVAELIACRNLGVDEG